jgi:thiamine biosynthesis lipoprotein
MATGTAWSLVGAGSGAVAVADRNALGTTARLAVWPPENLTAMLAVVDDELAALDAQASRFRGDSEISLLHAGGAGRHRISSGLAEVIRTALAAAEWTEGRCDPMVGNALIRIGYDRDFGRIETSYAPLSPDPRPRVRWQEVRLLGNDLTLPAGALLDVGATAKGLGADRAAAAAYASAGDGGVLVSLGGDIAVAGRPPAGGWPVLIADEHRQTRALRNLARPDAGAGARQTWSRPPAEADPATAQQIRLPSGGLATSSTTCRRWTRAGRVMHHIVDPATGMPAGGPWRTVTVVAATCAEANAAATAAIVAGVDGPDWLTDQGLPARLIGHDGQIAVTGGWPEAEDEPVTAPAFSRLADMPELPTMTERKER